jgi:hypothetical protein
MDGILVPLVLVVAGLALLAAQYVKQVKDGF